MEYEVIYGIDTWEGALDIDEELIKEGGVKFIIPRLNSISGGLRKDKLFDKQWQQSEPFVRFPYFVYTPWEKAAANYAFLKTHLPAGCRRVAIDIEVKRQGVSPSEYAANVAQFLQLVRNTDVRPVIYTGAWFLPVLSDWPSDVDYWWARYPYYLYPAQKSAITWYTLSQRLRLTGWNPGRAPGEIRLWQCSADRYILPGTAGRPIDVNVWHGTLDSLITWVGDPETSRPVSIEDRLAQLEIRVDRLEMSL